MANSTGLDIAKWRSPFDCNVVAQQQSNTKTFLGMDRMSASQKLETWVKRPVKYGRKRRGTKSKKEKELKELK